MKDQPQAGHNTAQANAEFRVAFTETNLRYALGASPRDEAQIARITKQLDEAKANLIKVTINPIHP